MNLKEKSLGMNIFYSLVVLIIITIQKRYLLIPPLLVLLILSSVQLALNSIPQDPVSGFAIFVASFFLFYTMYRRFAYGLIFLLSLLTIYLASETICV